MYGEITSGDLHLIVTAEQIEEIEKLIEAVAKKHLGTEDNEKMKELVEPIVQYIRDHGVKK